MPKITYFCGNEKRTAHASCEDFTLTKKRGKITVTAHKEITLVSAELVLPYSYDKTDRIFVNGYQSWTDSREYRAGESLKSLDRLPRSLVKKYAFDAYGDSFFKKYRTGVLHGYDISYIKGNNELFLLSLNMKNAYLIINHEVKANKIRLESDIAGLTLKAGESFTLFDFAVFHSVSEGMNAVPECLPNPAAPRILGYTSWYNYYQDIDEEKILQNLSHIDERFNLFQIDDGYEPFVGDWLSADKKKFPNGLAPIVEKIHEKGLLAGIWLAPFVAEEKSELFRTRKELFAKDEHGNFIKCGSNWSGFYALDITDENAREYIKKCLKYYLNMGFDFFKLDFLYAASLPHYPRMTRAMAARQAYELLRETLGDKLVLGCGACITSGFGLFDYMRIGPDLSLIFDDVWYMKYMHRERISTKVTLQNTIYRSFLDGKVFFNDPDVFLLRDENIGLSPEQRRAAAVINALFGSVLMTSDDIATYNDEAKELFSEILALRKAQEVSFSQNGDIIIIKYRMGEIHTICYDARKGIIYG